MFLLLFVAASIYYITGDYGDGIFMTIAILLVAAISLFQEARSRNAIDAENPDDDAYFEAKYMDRRNYEPVPKDLIKLEAENKVLKVQDLRKTFENGFKAVNGLNVKMYNG
jgi:Ca2+-transporting ATPase